MKHFFNPMAILLLLLHLGCQNHEAKDSIVALTDSTSVAGLSGDSVKLVKTASINLKVKNVEQTIRQVSTQAQSLGGMIYHQYLQALEGGRRELKLSDDSLLIITAYTPHADITARIPSQSLEAFMYGMADLGYYTSNSKMDIEDKSLLHLENALKQKNRLESLSASKAPKSKTTATLQTIAIKDETIEQGISNQTINADVKYSMVTLSLFQNPMVRKEVIANYSLSDYTLPFSKRWEQSLRSGWEGFLRLVLVISQLWVFIMAGIMIWFIYTYWKNRYPLLT